MQIAESVNGRRRIVAHLGPVHTEAELGLLLEQADRMLGDQAQGELDLGVEPVRRRARLVAPAAGTALFEQPAPAGRDQQPRVSAPTVIGTWSRLLFDVLAQLFDALGFATVADETFRNLVIARIVEPTSILDAGRVLADLGQHHHRSTRSDHVNREQVTEVRPDGED